MTAIMIGGHRGNGETDRPALPAADREKAPENTLVSLRDALQAGAQAVEIDVMLTRDGQVVVTHSNEIAMHIHPADREKTDKNRPFICQYDHQELRNFRIGRRNVPDEGGVEYIPLLSEVLTLLKEKDGILLNIEIKGTQGTECPEPPGLVAAIGYAIIKAGFPYNRLILSSFQTSSLEEVRTLIPDVPRGMLFRPEGGRGEAFTSAAICQLHMQLSLSYLHPEILTLNEEALAAAAEIGAGLNAWSLNEPLPHMRPEPLFRAIHLCRKYGLRLGLFTNYIREMREVLEKQA